MQFFRKSCWKYSPAQPLHCPQLLDCLPVVFWHDNRGNSASKFFCEYPVNKQKCKSTSLQQFTLTSNKPGYYCFLRFPLFNLSRIPGFSKMFKKYQCMSIYLIIAASWYAYTFFSLPLMAFSHTVMPTPIIVQSCHTLTRMKYPVSSVLSFPLCFLHKNIYSTANREKDYYYSPLNCSHKCDGAYWNHPISLLWCTLIN